MMLKLNGGRTVNGILRGFDPFMNVVIDETIEECRDGTKNNIGMVVRSTLTANDFACNVLIIFCFIGDSWKLHCAGRGAGAGLNRQHMHYVLPNSIKSGFVFSIWII